MGTGAHGWQADFPMREEVEDYAGRKRSFVITCHQGGLGFTVRAVEEGCGGAGYEFASYSETSPYSALGRVRQKMYRGLATRHITGSPGYYRMLHDRLSGRITSDRQGGIVLVVDGIVLGIENLAEILSTHEGWDFELEITDGLDWLSHLRDNETVDAQIAARLIQRPSPLASESLRAMEGVFLEKFGVGRGTYYRLNRALYEALDARMRYMRDRGIEVSRQRELVRQYVVEHGEIDNATCRGLCGLNRDQARRLLLALVDEGYLRPVGERRWMRYVPGLRLGG